jgi:hypothetical protein
VHQAHEKLRVDVLVVTDVEKDRVAWPLEIEKDAVAPGDSKRERVRQLADLLYVEPRIAPVCSEPFFLDSAEPLGIRW